MAILCGNHLFIDVFDRRNYRQWSIADSYHLYFAYFYIYITKRLKFKD